MQPLLASESQWQAEVAEGERRLRTQELVPAEACFRHALKDAKQKGVGADDRALCMQKLAAVLQMQDRTEEVIPLYKMSIRTVEKAHGPNCSEIVSPLLSLGSVFENEGDYKQAVKLYDRATLITEKTNGASSLDLAAAQHKLGRATFAAGSSQHAEQLYDSALSIVMKQASLPSTALLQDLLSDYIDLLNKADGQGKVLKSDFENELLLDRVGSLPRTKGIAASSWNKEVSARFADQANLKATQKMSEEERIFPPAPGNVPLQFPSIKPAQPIPDPVALEGINRQRIDFYERMIAIDIKSLGATHPSVARDLCGLAAIYLSQRRYDQAKPFLVRALEIYQQVYGPDALLVKRTQALLGTITEKQQPLTDEIPFDAFLAGLPKIPVEAQKLEIALKLNYLAFLSYSLGRVKDAERFYAWAVADTALSSGDTVLLASCLTDYGRVLRSSGRPAEAERMETNAQSILRRAVAKENSLSP